MHTKGSTPRPIADQHLWIEWEKGSIDEEAQQSAAKADYKVNSPMPLGNRESGFHKFVLHLDPVMLCHQELPLNRTTASAQPWLCPQIIEFMKTYLLDVPQPPPMSIFRCAEYYSAGMELPLEAARLVLLGLGRISGIEVHPWMTKGEMDRGLAARILWLKVPHMKESSQVWQALHGQ